MTSSSTAQIAINLFIGVEPQDLNSGPPPYTATLAVNVPMHELLRGHIHTTAHSKAKNALSPIPRNCISRNSFRKH